jgi:polyhydroxyalkanoate synthesis regulator phasin
MDATREEIDRLREQVAELQGRIRALERLVDTLTTALALANYMREAA